MLARVFDTDGHPVTGELAVNVTARGEQADPAIAVLADSSFVVVWDGSGDGDQEGVFARQFSASGAPLTGELRVNQTTTGQQCDPSVAATPDGGFVVAWRGRGPGDKSGVFAEVRKRHPAAGSGVPRQQPDRRVPTQSPCERVRGRTVARRLAITRQA